MCVSEGFEGLERVRGTMTTGGGRVGPEDICAAAVALHITRTEGVGVERGWRKGQHITRA